MSCNTGVAHGSLGLRENAKKMKMDSYIFNLQRLAGGGSYK